MITYSIPHVVGIPVPVGGAGLALPLASAKVQAGFPSPAEDHMSKRIDLNDVLVRHPQATFFLRVAGYSMVDAGIDDGDLLVVDRAIKPCHSHIVVAVVDGEFTVKILHMRSGRMKLVAANPTFAPIIPAEGQTVEIWGVVTACIKQFLFVRGQK